MPKDIQVKDIMVVAKDCVDKSENLAIERATKLFDVKFANVQPHSGAQANGAVFSSFKTRRYNFRHGY